MKTKIKQLKVKIKSLAVEARIIRLEEKRTKDPGLKASLAIHRRWDVRNEARNSILAYGFLRGLPYNVIESKTMKPIDWKRVEKLVEKFGECYDFYCADTYQNLGARRNQQERSFLDWKSQAEKYIESCKSNTG